MTNTQRHLWEIEHPYYGCSYNHFDFENFAELRGHINGLDEDMNFVYRWDWEDYSQPHHDDLFLPGEDRSKQELAVYVVMPRKDVLARWSCPITHEQEAEVLEWLHSPRVLGHLRKWWEPLLDETRV